MQAFSSRARSSIWPPRSCLRERAPAWSKRFPGRLTEARVLACRLHSFCAWPALWARGGEADVKGARMPGATPGNLPQTDLRKSDQETPEWRAPVSGARTVRRLLSRRKIGWLRAGRLSLARRARARHCQERRSQEERKPSWLGHEGLEFVQSQAADRVGRLVLDELKRVR